MRSIAMIPARLGSQRLKQKNLRQLGGIPLIVRAIQRALEADVFDEVWVNSESDIIGDLASEAGVKFHKRPAHFSSNTATSEDFVYEFIMKHECDYLFQVHSIAPLLDAVQIRGFVLKMLGSDMDVQLSVVNEQIECAMNDLPINFSFEKKQNSQELSPIQRITWSITGWKSASYINAYEKKECATYAGQIGTYSISREAGHIIKTEQDLQMAELLLKL
jgi:CMP-N-acetylneuraminic acid synthetase